MQHPLDDFEDLFEHAPCGYLSADAEGRTTRVNATFLTWTGYAGEGLLGRRFQELLNISGRIYYETHFAPLLRMQGYFNEVALDIIKADGSTLPVLINAVERRDQAGRVRFIRITVFKASDRRRYERDLLEARRAVESANAALGELAASLETQVEERTRERNRAWGMSQDLLVVAKTDGSLNAVNAAWTKLLGWTEHDLIGSTFMEFTHPDDLQATLMAFKGIFKAPLTTPYEYRLRHKDGAYRWFAWTAAFEDGLVYATGRDTTADREHLAALMKAEEQLRQAQKLEAIGQLTGGVAHDFNNLLTVIRSATDLLKRPDLPEERRTRYVGAISTTVDRASKLTAQLLAFARRQTLKPEVFAPRDSVRAIREVVSTLVGSRIKLVTDLPGERCFVNADPSQFDTALVNMAANARDAMAGEGQLTIQVQAVEGMPAVRAQSNVPGPFVQVCLSDTGSGIAPDKLEQIFEPFYTTKEVGKGTGLGLSQVFGFAKQSGGEVVVESAVGHGTTFTLYLPRVPDRPFQEVRADEPASLTVGHDTRVLVVEDNADVGSFAVQALIELGYLPILAAGAEEALAELAKDAERFNVVFSDVVMPGMSGVELGQEIRRRYPDLPVVLTSGYSHVLAQNGTHGFELLHKPYSVEQLSRVLRKAASWQSSRREGGSGGLVSPAARE